MSRAAALQSVVLQEAVFLLLACACLAWAQWRLPRPSARFPGPRPVGPVFKAWLVTIWVVGLLLPLAALVVDGAIGGSTAAALALLPYFWAFAAQVASELFCWKRWGSPVWVIVPCLYLPWRVWQGFRGLEYAPDAPLLTTATLYALILLWIINVGVHYTNIPASLRWDYHRRDATFASLHDPLVFRQGSQDARDVGGEPGRDAGRDSLRDSGRDPLRDSGRDPLRDSGRDAARP